MSKIEKAARHYIKGQQLLREIQKESGLPFCEVVEQIDSRKRIIEDMGV